MFRKTYAYSGISVCSESEDTVSDTDPNNAYLVTNDTLTQGQVEWLMKCVGMFSKLLKRVKLVFYYG